MGFAQLLRHGRKALTAAERERRFASTAKAAKAANVNRVKTSLGNFAKIHWDRAVMNPSALDASLELTKASQRASQMTPFGRAVSWLPDFAGSATEVGMLRHGADAAVTGAKALADLSDVGRFWNWGTAARAGAWTLEGAGAGLAARVGGKAVSRAVYGDGKLTPEQQEAALRANATPNFILGLDAKKLASKFKVTDRDYGLLIQGEDYDSRKRFFDNRNALYDRIAGTAGNPAASVDSVKKLLGEMKAAYDANMDRAGVAYGSDPETLRKARTQFRAQLAGQIASLAGSEALNTIIADRSKEMGLLAVNYREPDRSKWNVSPDSYGGGQRATYDATVKAFGRTDLVDRVFTDLEDIDLVDEDGMDLF
jgi:hypothetical protein